MEGSVNLQTEGHIGVVCFGRFNASIEARRLPSDWEWVPSDSDPMFEDTASLITADDHGVIRQLHSTGYWVDGNGDKVKGRIRFRIRNFDVGTTGETSYLSLEGTMLDRAAEKQLVAEEAERVRARKAKRGALLFKRERKSIPEFAVTKFAADADAQTQNQPQDLETGEGMDDVVMPNRMTTDD
jgi:DNA-directed RNA polymerase I subunit RPA43